MPFFIIKIILQNCYFYAIFMVGDGMTRKEQAVDLIKKVSNGESYLTYKEIAKLTGYHEKYLLKLKKELNEGKLSLVHGNKDRKPVNTISEEERKYIISLYKRSNTTIRKFCRFYAKRSYSCIWHVLHNEGLI